MLGNTCVVRAPKRRRPQRRTICPAPPGVSLAKVAADVRYVGSPEHKVHPSFAGPPRPRADATKCDPSLADPGALTGWIREAILKKNFGEPWEGDFPRYVWHQVDGTVYEGRLVNQELGEYKGWPLEPGEWPEGLHD